MGRNRTAFNSMYRLLCTGLQSSSSATPRAANCVSLLAVLQSHKVDSPACSYSPCQWHLSRCISSSTVVNQHARNNEKGSRAGDDKGIVTKDEEFSAITDKIPQRPVTVVEGTSYTLLIIAALGFAAAVLYAALKELVFSPKEYECFNTTLSKIKDDPRVTVRLGAPISAYGSESRNRAARQRIPHRIYTDQDGREHVQIQFHMKGPSGRALVSADMFKDAGNWRYHFLYLNVESPIPQQVVLVRPGQVEEF